MAIDLNGPVSGLVVAALDAASLRHEVIASNIANVNTPEYHALQVNFEQQLAKSLEGGELYNDASLRARLNSVKPEILESKVAFDTAQLDMQMVDLTKNTLRYHALLKGLQDYGSITKLAIKEGKG